MYDRDHLPPHFHAEYGDHEVLIEIATNVVLDGGFPRSQLRRVLDWAALHRDDLISNWDLARALEPLRPIEPLD